MQVILGCLKYLLEMSAGMNSPEKDGGEPVEVWKIPMALIRIWISVVKSDDLSQPEPDLE